MLGALIVDLYRTKDWKNFRAEVIRLDGGACTECGRGPTDGVTLHVHHKAYLPGKKPWQYPYDMCHTLCGGCHAAQHGLIPPKFGWEYAGWEDLGDLTGTCDCCGTAIRYSFMVAHADWFPMEVGEICCDNLTSSQVASGFMDSKRRFASRLKRFVSSKRWQQFPNGINHITQKQLIVRIAPSDGGFRTWVNGIMGKVKYDDVLGAKIAIFEALESGAVHKFLAARRRTRT